MPMSPPDVRSVGSLLTFTLQRSEGLALLAPPAAERGVRVHANGKEGSSLCALSERS